MEPELRRLAHAPAHGDPATAMRIVHRALDETAGHTVFLDNLDRQLFASPHRAPLRERTLAMMEAFLRQVDGGSQSEARPQPAEVTA